MFCLCSLLGVLWCHVLVFKSLSHFEFIFVHDVRVCSGFIDLYAAVQFSQHYFLKRLFHILYCCLLCRRLIDPGCLGLFLGSLFCYIDPYVCFGTSTTLSWWLWLCNTVWSERVMHSVFVGFFVLVWFLFVFLGLHLWHMEVPRLGVEMEL